MLISGQKGWKVDFTLTHHGENVRDKSYIIQQG